MFPLTHLYVNQIILGNLSPEMALGSVLPDLLTSNGVDWALAHRMKLHYHLSQDIIYGDALHGSELPGLDYYTDKNYKHDQGYAFYKAKYIKENLIHLGIPEQDALWRGHNIIEMAVEVNIRNRTDTSYQTLLQMLGHRDLLRSIEQNLSLHLEQPINLEKGIALFAAQDGQQKKLADYFTRKINSHHGLLLLPQNIEHLIDQAQTIIERDYMSFLEICIQKMTDHLKKIRQP